MFRFLLKFVSFLLIIISISCNSDTKETLLQTNTSTLDSLYAIAKRGHNDSLLNDVLKKQIRFYYKNENWNTFNKYRFEHLSLTKRIKDTFAYAKTLEYSGNYFRFINQLDSAYFYYQKSFKNYELVKNSLRAGSVLLNKAIIQKNVKDYRGSEITSFKALDFLRAANHKRRIASVYNNLGILYNQLDDMQGAIKYHTLAKDIRETLDHRPILVLHSINNIGKVYADNDQYDMAIENYQQLLNDTLLKSSPKLHAIVIDNNAYAHFKNGDSITIENDLKKALSIRDSIEDLNGSIINCIHLAEFYLQKQDSLTALVFAKRAEKLSQETHNYRDYLRSLHLLSSLYPKNKAAAHFNKYIAIRDSLDKVALTYEKSFERIEFEVDQKESLISNQNKELAIKSKTIYIIVILIMAITITVYFIVRSKRKKRSVLREKAATGYRNYLIDKYKLTSKNIEFWELWITGISQKELSERLFITVEAIDSRRKSLRKKISTIQKIEGDFDQSLAIIIYNKEKEIFNSISSNP